MHSLLLFDVDQRKISAEDLERVFESVVGFTDIRHNTPTGTPIEAAYTAGDDYTTVRLSSDRETISIRGTSGAALKAAWIIHKRLTNSFRMADTDYSFDIMLDDYQTIDDLIAAVE